jgi:hypothetical protein
MNTHFCEFCEWQVPQVRRVTYHHPNGEVYSVNTCQECQVKNQAWELSWVK